MLGMLRRCLNQSQQQQCVRCLMRRHIFRPCLKHFHSPAGTSTITTKRDLALWWKFPRHQNSYTLTVGHHCLFKVPLVEEENEHFHVLLKKNDCYKPYMIMHKSLDPSSSQENIYSALKYLVSEKPEKLYSDIFQCLCNLSTLPDEFKWHLLLDKRFAELCQLLQHELPTLKNSEFFECLQILSTFNFRHCITTSRRVLRLDVAESFNQECMIRADQWSIQQLFQAADFFYYLRCSQRVNYMKSLFYRLGVDIAALSHQEVVLLLFYASLSRNFPKSLLRNITEFIVFKHSELSLEEMAIISLGYFKTNSPIHSHLLLMKMAEKLYSNAESTTSFCMSAIFKSFSKSTTKTVDKKWPELYDVLCQLLDKVTSLISHLPLNTFMHITLYYHHIQFVSEEFISEVKSCLKVSSFASWRIKDIAKLMFCVGNLGSLFGNMDDFCTDIITELQSVTRDEEISHFPDCLLMILLGMAFQNIYPEKLISKVFSSEYLQFFKESKKDYLRDLYQLNESVLLEKPEYSGNRLPLDFLQSLPKDHDVFGKLPDKGEKTARTLLFNDFVNYLTKILKGRDKFKVDFLLPHFQTADVEIRLDLDDQPIPCHSWEDTPKHPESEVSGLRKHRLADILLELSRLPVQSRRLALLLFGPNAYCTVQRRTGSIDKELLGLHTMKSRQLRKKGYEVIQIPYFQLDSLQYLSYLRKKIFSDTAV